MNAASRDLKGLSHEEKLTLLDRLARQRRRTGATFPLSFAQQRMWFLDRLDPGNPANNIFRALTFGGRLDSPALGRALAAVVRRHEALRTVFPIVGDEPRQRVLPMPPDADLPLPLLDLSGLPAERRLPHTLELARREARHAFDLARGPLFRATLVRLAATEHALFLNLHHVVADGWSMSLLARELTVLYRAFVTGLPSPLPEPALQYPDFAVWQRERMAGERLAAELDWWRGQVATFADTATVLELPADRLRPAAESFRGSLARLTVPPDTESGLRALARDGGATLFMTLLAAFEILLYRYTGQAGFLVGTTVAGRHRPEVEELIGFFANTLLLRADLAGNPGFRPLLSRVRASTLGAYGHQELPFERLVEELQPERDLSHHPLFQVLFALQNLPPARVALPGLAVGALDVERGLSKLDLTLDLAETRQGIAGYFEYSADLFEAATVARMTGHFLTLLAALVAAPDRGIAELPLLTPDEREQLLFGWNPEGYELRPPVPMLVALQACRAPQAPAVLCGDERLTRLTYTELDTRANQLARYLRRRGVGPDTRVGLALERSLAMTVSLLGILKAGAAYVPLDPAYPRERLALMIEDTGMPVLLTESRLAGCLPEETRRGAGPEVLCLDAERERIAAEDPGDPDWEILGEGLAYVIYTSGSTGRPKGVGVPHRALANHATECARRYALTPADRVLQFTSISFDITSEEIFPTWIAGGAVVPRPPGLFPSFAELETLLTRHGVTVVNLPTAYWHEWASDLHRGSRRPPASLRLAIVGTEQALPERLAEWLTLPGSGAPGVGFANSYASTECTVTALIHFAGPESAARARAGHRIPVGRPIDNCRVYVLDAFLEPVPIGVPGDVYIGGANVARGYLGQPARTAAVFVPDPFGACGPGGRLYRQGDRGRFLPTGELECLGRSDDQVKVRGYRIEPGEIEAVLARHPGVRECVVLVRDDGQGLRRLVAYVAQDPGHRTTADELRAYLKESLPEYMVPAGLVVLEDLPLTANGKVDRGALRRIDPALESTPDAAGDGAPRTPLEEVVAEIWSQVLSCEGVGIHDNFFDLGGHSLLATQVIARVREGLGVDLPLRTLFEEPTVAGLAAAVAAAQRSAGGLSAPPRAPIPPIPRELRTGPLPCSFAQQRLWVVDQLTPGNPGYNLSDTLRWQGPLDVVVLSHALSEVVRRHEALRTTFAIVDGNAVQVIAPPASASVPLPLIDLTGEPAAFAEALRRAAEAGRRPFHLGRGPLFRAALYRLTSEDHLLHLSVHHIVSDGASNQILLRELLTLYAVFSRGEPSPLAELPVQYADFAAWQRGWLQGEARERQLAYWRRVLAGAPPVLDLPADRPRPAIETTAGARHAFTLPRRLARDLARLGRRFGTTLFMTLLAGFDALLGRWSGQDDVVVGWPIAGRGRSELSGVIGFFANLLVQRARLAETAEETTFARLLGAVKASALDAYTHGDLPFEVLVEALRPERHLSYNPIFQVLFVFHGQAGRTELPGAIPGTTVDLLPVEAGSSLLDLSLAVTELRAFFEYKTALFDPATVARLAGYLVTLLAGAAAQPGMPLADLPLLSAAEERQLVVGWNDTALSLPEGATAHGLFAARMAADPGVIALISEEEILSYGELDLRADRLARRLIRRLGRLGIGPGALVGICLERSAAMVVSILAVLKAGAAYVPLDPTYPAERLAFLLEDSGVRLLLTESVIAGSLPPHDVDVLALDEPEPVEDAGDRIVPLPSVGPEDLAYVLYTSGSTGRPKGVEVRHGGLANFLLSMAREPGLAAQDALLAVTTLSFDIAGLELYLPLAVGARIVLASRAAAADGKRLAALLKDSGATALQATPATWRMLLAAGWSGQRNLKALCGGEALPADLARELLPRVAELWNLYGPTETTIWSAVEPVRAAGAGVVPIGRPIANTALHLLDRRGKPMPIGAVGELYIGGLGVARGYLRRPELTAERFVPDPFTGVGARLYRTGDLARRLPDGRVEFLGRVDHQVKVRGFRIELGEVEAALTAHPAVRQAAVAVWQEGLVAYVVAEGAAGHLRAALREELPEHMVPSRFVFLPDLPRTPNGKIDCKALPPPDAELQAERKVVLPRTPIEERVAAIWSAVLGLERIGVHDNFFERGGHSLMATQVISRLEESFGVELGLPAIFKTPTIAALAETILAREGLSATLLAQPIPRASRAPGLFPLSFAQQRLWFLTQYEPESPEYNIPQGFRIAGPLSPDLLARTLEAIVARHEALRTTFKAVDGQPMQIPAERQRVELPVADLTHRPEGEREAVARSVAVADARCPFDLTLGPLFRPLLFRLGPEEYLFFLNVHHIVYDGWSRGVFLAELAAIYEAFDDRRGNRPSPLPELAVQYLDFALWQRDGLSGEVLARQLAYWRERLAGVPPLDLATDRPRPALRTYNGAACGVFLPAATVEALTRLGQAAGGTLYVALSAAWKALLHHYTGQEDFAHGTLIANRTRPELEKLIGFFANTLALRTDLSGDPTFGALVAREREVALGAYAHQDLPFEKLVEELNPQRDLARTPFFQTMLILLNAPGKPLEIPGLTISEVAIDNATAKFEMTLYMVQGEEGLAGYLEYNTDLFDAPTIRRFLDHFRALASGVAEDPGTPLSAFPWLSAAEARQLLADWNATAADFPRDRCLHELFTLQAARTPRAVAVELEGERLTYRELGARSDRLARRLCRLGVGPEILVGLAVERSFDMMVGLLGILKAGGAYVPLDPEYPRERLAYMLEESRLAILLTQERLLPKLPETAARVLALDRDLPESEAETPETSGTPESGVGPENLAYILYTSGSTGKPKGVQIPHRAVVNFLASMSRRPGMSSADTLLAVTTLSFDIAGLELYLPFVNGARVVLVPRDVAQAGEQLVDRLVRSGTTVMQATPATWRLLLGAGWKGDGLLRVLCGGEALPRDLADSLLANAASLWNVYGPTEATIWSMLQPVPREGRITLGRPLDNTQVYLFSPRARPVPVGVPGELHIGGEGLARGYRNRPDLTAERFVPDPFSRLPGARLYRTGDLARHLPDGTVEFLGRIDHQVKVRGFRIELGEIETVLAQHPGVAQAVVLAREDTPGTKRLVAYLTARAEAPRTQELRDFLKARLPEYMLPALFVPLPALPLTPNGKVDRRALPAPDQERASDRPYVAPSNPVEEELAALWAEILGVKRVGVNDDFFELGGDSLLVIRVVAKANKGGLGVTTKQLFQHRTVVELAKVAGTTHVLAEQEPVAGVVPFTPAQVHFIELRHTLPHYHSLGSLLEAKEEMQPEAARRAFHAVVIHHDNLRVRLVEDAAGQRLVTDSPWTEENLPFLRLDLPELPEADFRRQLTAIVVSLIQGFDLARGPLFRGVLLAPAGGANRRTLVLIGHFFVADIGSWQTILDDFDIAYRQAVAGAPIVLQKKTTSARQWADRLAERAHSMDMAPEKEYWFSDARRAAPALPLDFPEGENTMASSLSVRVEFNTEETAALLTDVPRAYGVQIDALLLTSILFAFVPWTGARRLLIDLLGHGREPLYDDVDLTRTVGWLNTIYPAFLTLPESGDPGVAVRHVNEQLRRIPNGGIGYGILRYLSRDQDFLERARSMPQPGIFFNYFGDDHSQELVALTKVEGFGGYGLDSRTRRLRPLAIGVYIQKDRMLIKWERSTNIHRVETIEALAERSASVLRRLIAHPPRS